MAEESKSGKYIECGKCRSRCINDEEHVSKQRLGEIYDTRVTCRGRNKVNKQTYYDKHRYEHKHTHHRVRTM